MKYRVLEEGGRFYPQYRRFLVWFPVMEDNGFINAEYSTLQGAKSGCRQHQRQELEARPIKTYYHYL